MPTRMHFLVLAVLAAGCSAHRPSPATSTPAATPARPAATATGAQPLVFLDGEEIFAADVRMIDSASIASIDVVKGANAIALHGERAKAGIIQIATKPAAVRTTPTTPLFLLDGREIPPQLARVLDTRKISSVEVLKGPAALPYGARAQAGVVVFRSKAD